PALADAPIEHCRFDTRVRADEQDGIGLLDALYRRIEEVARAPERRIELRAVLTTVEIADAASFEQRLQREHFLRATEIAGNGADPLGRRPFELLGDKFERLAPGCRLEAAIAAHIGPVEPLGPE